MKYNKKIAKKTITLSIPMQSLDTWETYALKNGKKISYVMEDAIEMYLSDISAPQVEVYNREERGNLVKQSFFLPVQTIDRLKSATKIRNESLVSLVEQSMWKLIGDNGSL